MDLPGALVLNLMARGGAIALLVLLAVGLLRARPDTAAARLGAAFALGTAATTWGDAPGLGLLASRVPVAALAAGNMAVFWAFTRALLDDRFALRRRHLAAWTLLAALGLLNCQVRWPALSAGLTLLGIGFALAAVAQSAASWREDLVEGRRRVRVVIVAAAAAYAVAVAVVALAPGVGPVAAFSSTWHALGLLLLTGAVGGQLLRLRSDGLLDPPPNPVAAPPTPTPAAEPEVDPRLVARLDRLMAHERVYREPELNIGGLAARMELPEHRLRKLINQGLGYRNFSSFLNGYRVADAKAALGDPARAGEAILTIAMAAGFPSIGPFNRAFKASTGQTPSEYRRAHPASTRPQAAEIERG